MKLKSRRMWNGKQFVSAEIVLEGGKIASINETVLSHDDLRIVPGFISMHDHGALGINANELDHGRLEAWSRFLIEEGVTSFYATTSTAPFDTLIQGLSVYKDYVNIDDGAWLLGVNAEGPMFSKDHHAKGAHLESNLVEPSIETFETMMKASGNRIQIMTIAPELDGAIDTIAHATHQGVKVFMGHTMATALEARRGLEAGACGFTHLFNGMRPLHHREVGVAGVGLFDPSTYSEMIADGVHLSDEAIRMIYASKPLDKLITITDSVMAKGLKPGVHWREDKKEAIRIDEMGRVYLPDGRLAGSTNKMSELLKYQVETVGIPVEKVLPTMACNQSVMMGLNKGHIELGFDADLVLLDTEYRVVGVIVGGKVLKGETLW